MANNMSTSLEESLCPCLYSTIMFIGMIVVFIVVVIDNEHNYVLSLFFFDLNKDKVLCTVSTVFIHLTLTLTRTLFHRELCSIAEALLVYFESSAALIAGGFDGSDFTAEPSPATSENTGLNQLLPSMLDPKLPLVQSVDSQWLLPMLECLLHISSSFC